MYMYCSMHFALPSTEILTLDANHKDFDYGFTDPSVACNWRIAIVDMPDKVIRRLVNSYSESYSAVPVYFYETLDTALARGGNQNYYMSGRIGHIRMLDKKRALITVDISVKVKPIPARRQWTDNVGYTTSSVREAGTPLADEERCHTFSKLYLYKNIHTDTEIANACNLHYATHLLKETQTLRLHLDAYALNSGATEVLMPLETVGENQRRSRMFNIMFHHGVIYRYRGFHSFTSFFKLPGNAGSSGSETDEYGNCTKLFAGSYYGVTIPQGFSARLSSSTRTDSLLLYSPIKQCSVRNTGSFASLNAGIKSMYSAKDMYASILDIKNGSKCTYIDEFTNVISAMSADMIKLINSVTEHIQALRQGRVIGGNRLTTKSDSTELLIVCIHPGLTDDDEIKPTVTSVQINSEIRSYLKNDWDLSRVFRVLSSCDKTEALLEQVFADSYFAKNYDSYKDRINKLRTYHVLAEE